MENEILKKLDEQKQIIDKIEKSVEKTRKYFLWTMIITIVVLVLPLVGLAFVMPSFLNTYLDNINSLGL